MIVDVGIIAAKAFLVLFMVLNLAGVLGWIEPREARSFKTGSARIALRSLASPAWA